MLVCSVGWPNPERTTGCYLQHACCTSGLGTSSGLETFLVPVRMISNGARTLLGGPGIATRSKKLLGAKGIATRSKDTTRNKCIASSNKKLVEASALLLVTRTLLGAKGIATYRY